MSIKGTFKWSGKEYTAKIENYTVEALTRHHHLKMARYYSLWFGIGVTVGHGGMGLFYSLRQIKIIRQKLNIITSTILKNGWEVPRRRVRDMMVGIGVGILTVDIGIWSPVFIHCLIGEVVSEVSTNTMPLVTGVPMPGIDALGGVGHGVHDALLMQGHAVDAGGFVPSADIDAIGVNAAIQPGYAMGVEATIALEDQAATRASQALLKKAASSVA